MPFVNVMVTREGVTNDQKRRVISGVTKLLQDELGKDPRTTHVVIQEVETENWGVGGLPCLEFRANAK